RALGKPCEPVPRRYAGGVGQERAPPGAAQPAGGRALPRRLDPPALKAQRLPVIYSGSMRPYSAGVLSLVLWGGALLQVRAQAIDPKGIDLFEKRIRPLLAERCYECHGEKRQWGGLRLDSRAGLLQGGTRGHALVPGRPEESLLIKVVSYSSDLRMP